MARDPHEHGDAALDHGQGLGQKVSAQGGVQVFSFPGPWACQKNGLRMGDHLLQEPRQILATH
jgi:hypothetical protein